MDGVKLRAWLVPARGERIIILIHGSHNNAWGCQASDYVQAYRQAGFDVFLFDLRGHGQSGGNHFGLGQLEQNDVHDVVKLLMKKGFKPGHIGIHGTSYGASIALLATAQIDEVAAVIADSAFANIRDVIGGELERQTDLPSAFAEIFLPGLRLLGLMIYSLDINESAPENIIGRISPRPILLIHGWN
jgi:dipeptidyl aminopeptidase/acylaminoacyl peptidase